MKKLLFISYFFICTIWQANAQWTIVGNANFTAGIAPYTDIAFNGSTPYVAYKDDAHSGKATVMKFNGASWVNVGSPGFSAGMATYVSITFNNSIPYVSYRDEAHSNKATVMKFNGNSWVNVGLPGFSSGEAYYVSLAFSGTTPYVTFSDILHSQKATVMKFNGASWVNVGSPAFSTDIAWGTDIAIYGGTPYVVYGDGGNSFKSTVKKFNGSSWVNVGLPGFSAGQALFTSIVFSNGAPYVAYQDFGHSGKATVMRFNGLSWVNVGTAGFSPASVGHLSLAFNGLTPYVAFTDEGPSYKATVMKFTGNSWVYVGSPDFSATIADGTNLAFSGGTPYVVYSSGVLDGGKATVMKYKTIPFIKLDPFLVTFATCIGFPSLPQSFTVSGSDLTAGLTILAPTGFEVSTSRDNGYGRSISIRQTRGEVSDTIVYIRLKSTAEGYPSGNIICTSYGATTRTIPVRGQVNRLPTINISGAPTLCAGQSTILTASGAHTYQWRGGPATAEYRVSPLTTTRYTVSGTDSNQCSAFASKWITVSRICDTVRREAKTNFDISFDSDIIEAGKTAEISIYPNPNKGHFNVSVPASFGQTATIEIININGEVIYRNENKSTGSPIEIGIELKEGIYNLRVITEGNISSQKVIVTD